MFLENQRQQKIILFNVRIYFLNTWIYEKIKNKRKIIDNTYYIPYQFFILKY